jgi:hypothetical protein
MLGNFNNLWQAEEVPTGTLDQRGIWRHLKRSITLTVDKGYTLLVCFR